MSLHPDAIVGLKVDGDDINIIDQLQLPHVKTYISINSPNEAYDAIKTMKIRGAPAIASLAALSVSSHLSHLLSQSPSPEALTSPSALKDYLNPILSHLSNARPTAVNLSGAMRRLTNLMDQNIGDESEASARELAEALIIQGRSVAEEDIGRNILMSKHGAEWVSQQPKSLKASKLNIMTVCNTGSLATSGYGTAFGLITRLHELSKLENAFYSQSTPYHQGSRLTALELQSLNIPSTMICDSMVGSLFQHHEIHAVVVGADRIARNGDTANKVGTYNAAVLAARHQIPFVVVAPVSTVDMDIPDGSHIPIEHRPAIEACLVRGVLYPVVDPQHPQPATIQFTPLNMRGVYNPSFDVTPAELISAIVTEKGVATKSANGNFFDLSNII